MSDLYANCKLPVADFSIQRARAIYADLGLESPKFGQVGAWSAPLACPSMAAARQALP